MLQKVYDGMMDKAGHRHALAWLAAVAFVESSVFPIPPDVMLIPMVMAAPTRWWRLALVCTLASVAGGFLGYAIGALAMDTIGWRILDLFHLRDGFIRLKPTIDEWGVWFIIAKGWTPIPYKLVTITAGAFHFDLMKFAGASVVARAMRFFPEALLLWRFGPPIRDFVERRLKLVTTAFVVLLVGGFLAVKFL